jgi:hypothetical protein
MAAFFAGFFVASSAAAFTSSVPASFFTSSFAALTVLSLLPLQPLPAGFTTFSAPPALSLLAPQPLSAACAPGREIPPAVINPATPRPARNFLRSLFAIETSLKKERKEKNIEKETIPASPFIEKSYFFPLFLVKKSIHNLRSFSSMIPLLYLYKPSTFKPVHLHLNRYCFSRQQQ